MTMIFSHHRFARGFVGSGYIFVNRGTQQESSRVEDLFRILNLMRRPVFFCFPNFHRKKSEDLIFCTQNNLQKKKYNNHHQSNPRFDEFLGEEEQFFDFLKKTCRKKRGWKRLVPDLRSLEAIAAEGAEEVLNPMGLGELGKVAGPGLGLGLE